MSLLVGVLLVSSCTINYTLKKPLQPLYNPNEKINLKVAVNLTDELRKTQYEHYQWGVTENQPVGSKLAEYVPSLARQTFLDVVEINNGAPPPKPVDAVLTPKLAFFGVRPNFGTISVDVKLEWTLVDPDGSVIWADTCTGQITGRGGLGFQDLLGEAMERALVRSQAEIASSEAIRQFARKKYPDAVMTGVTNQISAPDAVPK